MTGPENQPAAGGVGATASLAATRRATGSASRLVLLQSVIGRAGVALGIGTIGMSLLALADRLVGPGLPKETWWVVASGTVAAALAWSGLRAWRAQLPLLRVASLVDQRLDLKDRLGSGLALEHAARTDAFAAMAIADADAAAVGLRLQRAAPIRLDNWWIVWPVFGVAAIAISFIQPMRLLADRQLEAALAEKVNDASDAERKVAEAVEVLEQVGAAGDAETSDLPPQSDRLSALEKLKEQLANGEASPDDARAQAAGALTSASESLARESEEDLARHDKSAELLSKLPDDVPGTNGSESPAGKLAQALRGADPGAAAGHAQSLAQNADSMTPAERASEAARLNRLAQELRELAEAERAGTPEPGDTLRELKEQGLNEDEARELTDEAPESTLESRLKEKGFDESTAEELARKIARERVERESKQQSINDANQLADDLQQAAEQLSKPPASPSAPPTTPDPADGKEPGDTRASPSTEPRPSTNSTPAPPTGDPGQRPGAKQGDPKSPPEQQTRNPPRNEAPESAPSSRPESPDQRKPSTEGAPAKSDANPGSATPKPQSPADSNSQKGAQSGQDKQQGDGGKQPAESGKPNAQPGGQQGDSAKPSKVPDGQPGQQDPASSGTNQGAPKPPDSKPGQPDAGGSPGQKGGTKPSQQSETPPDGMPESGNGSPGQSATPRPQPSETGQPGGSATNLDSTTGNSGSRDREGQDPGSGHGSGAGKGRATEQPLDAVQDRLQRMAERPRNAAQKSRDAARIREQAERLLEGATPEQRKHMERLARQRASEQGATPPPLTSRSVPTDFRRTAPETDPSAEVLGEFNDPKAMPSGRDAVGRRAMQPTAQEALQSAQRAIEERQLPARYKNVERYFKRAAEREQKPGTSGPAPNTAPPVKDAKDAG